MFPKSQNQKTMSLAVPSSALSTEPIQNHQTNALWEDKRQQFPNTPQDTWCHRMSFRPSTYESTSRPASSLLSLQPVWPTPKKLDIVQMSPVKEARAKFGWPCLLPFVSMALSPYSCNIIISAPQCKIQSILYPRHVDCDQTISATTSCVLLQRGHTSPTSILLTSSSRKLSHLQKH